MAKFSPTSARARLRSLEKAKERAATLKRGETMTAQPMSKLIGVSWPVLRGWCDEIEGFEESGAFERGANGIEYTFHPRRVIAYLVKHFTQIVKSEEKQVVSFAEDTGVHLTSDDDNISFREVKDRLDATFAVTLAAERMGKTCQTSLVEELFVEAFDSWVMGVMGIKTVMDPNGRMTPAQRTELEDNLRLACAKGHEGVKKTLERLRAGSEQKGTRRSV